MKQLVLLPGLSHNTLQFLIPDGCSELVCFKTWYHQSGWQTLPHLSGQSILLSCAVRLDPRGQKWSTLLGNCHHRSHTYSLPALTAEIVHCVLSLQSLPRPA